MKENIELSQATQVISKEEIGINTVGLVLVNSNISR
jgi:hypothetical protein